MLQTNIFRIVRLTKDWQRQFGSFRLNVERCNLNFDLTCRQIFVHSFAVTRNDCAFDRDDTFDANPLKTFKIFV